MVLTGFKGQVTQENGLEFSGIKKVQTTEEQLLHDALIMHWAGYEDLVVRDDEYLPLGTNL